MTKVPAAAAYTEPDFATACQWWPEIDNIYTPVGWKNHLFRFNVFWNGMLLAQPNLNRRTEAWKDQGVQLTFIPYIQGEYKRAAFHFRDDGLVRQGWCDGPTPRLWSEWPDEGVLLREEVFAHVPGGQPIVRGDEPLFAWVRLSIAWTCPGLPLEPHHGFLIKVSKPHLKPRMSNQSNLHFNFADSPYPRPLAPDADGPCPAGGWHLAEADGRVRLAVAPGRPCQIKVYRGDQFMRTSEWVFVPATEKDTFVHVLMDAKVGQYVDLLVPMLPTDRATFDRELALGFDKALAEANAYWSVVPATAARVHTPETPVNEAIVHSLKFAEVIAERNPADGIYASLSGSFQYANVNATALGMTLTMLMDGLGYHQAAETYLEPFRRAQGTAPGPSEYLKPHPGYFIVPKTLTGVDWLTDHGGILYASAAHAMLSGDEDFAARWTDPIVKGCEFIAHARAATGHPGHPGLLPPAVATDRGTVIQAIWSDGWAYKGLTTAVRFLGRIGHPRAAEFAAEAADYRKVFAAALRAKTRRQATWTDDQGKVHHFVPCSMAADKPEESRHAFYHETGPLFLVFAGLMDASDELMESSRTWFREGPQVKMFRPESCCWQVPCLVHEISSCEPCYSWAGFHSHQLGDRARFLECMYSVLAAGMSRRTYTSCETRGGVCGTLFSAMLGIHLARLAVVDDQLDPDELHLLRMVPLAWVRSDQETVFERMPTEFGPVSLGLRLSGDGKELNVTCAAQFRHPPRRILLHRPPLKGLRRVVLNGKPLPFPAGKAVREVGSLLADK